MHRPRDSEGQPKLGVGGCVCTPADAYNIDKGAGDRAKRLLACQLTICSAMKGTLKRRTLRSI